MTSVMQDMKKEIYWLGWAVFAIVFIGSLCGTGLCSSSSEVLSPRKRADVIDIDTLAVFGDLEKSSVAFLHDKHTEALAQRNLDCTACHLTKNDQIYPKFKRTEDTGRIEVMNIYHDGCISCHGQMNLAKEKTGPVECDACHRTKDRYVSSGLPMGMDQSLHFRHSKASKNECRQCHHEYNEIEKTLFYAKGEEGTCRYCHAQETRGNLISMRLASHIACVNCHLKTKPAETIKPPVNCSGCHDAAIREKIKKATGIPRMDRNQPDAILLKTAPKNLIMDKGVSLMNLVLFDHKIHEKNNDTCRVCHHANLKSCKTCHTLNGSPEGKGISLERAAHKAGSPRSCVGCHSDRKQTENCAGCHSSKGSPRKLPDAACSKCHSVAVPETGLSPDPAEEKALIASMLPSRDRTAGAYSLEGIPERVVIKRLASQYEPVEFPHLKVVTALVDNIKDDHLAGYFHGSEGTLCQGCHHNSPLSRRPPNCGNCHPKLWSPDEPTKPGILGAYHQQCIGCHRTMNIEKPMGCTECHKERVASN